MLSLDTVIRLHYGSYFAAALAYYCFPAEAQEYLGFLHGFDLAAETTQVLLKMQVALFFTTGCIWVSVAHFTEADASAKRKAIQYGMATHMLCAGVYLWKGSGFVSDQVLGTKVVLCLCGLALCCLAVYKWHADAGTPDKSNDEQLTKCCRFEYVQMALWGIFFVGCPWAARDALPSGLPQGPSTDFYICLRGAMLLGTSILMMGVAQCDAACQKALLQYAMVKRFVMWFYLLPILSPYILSSVNGLTQFYCVVIYEFVNIANMIHSCYPCALRKWIIRVTYLLFTYMAVLNLFFPALSASFWQIADLGTTAHILGMLQLMVALNFMAASQSDADDGQKTIVQYSVVGHGIMLFMQATGYNFGLLPYVSFALLIVSVGDSYRDIFLEKFGSFGKAAPASGKKSAPARGRSRTPAGKK